MTAELKSSLVTSLEAAAAKAGLTLVSVTRGADFQGHPTAVFELGLAGNAAAGRSLKLELSEAFDFDTGVPSDKSSSLGWKSNLLPEMTAHLAGEAKRLRNPRPECYVTLGGLPLAFGKFEWPFHQSTSGADTHIVHGELQLADGGTQGLHAKISASVTLTFAEIVPAMEQPYAETFIYNAVRKTVDMGQLEFVKSGNRQPVPVTTRYYSRWQKKFIFTETDDEERLRMIELDAERRPQRTGRNDVAVADAAAAIEEDDREILLERGILQPVVHHDDAGAGELREFRAGDAVARDDGRSETSQQQRFVADLRGVVDRRIDAHRAGKPSAVAAAEEEWPLARREEEMGDRKRSRRLAGAADGEVAEANHRHTGAAAVRLHAHGRHRAIDRGQGREQAACAGSPPEGRLAQHVQGARCSSRSCIK